MTTTTTLTATDQTYLQEAAQRYQKELDESVIPFWQTHCPDTKHGAYFTCLDRDGSVYDTEKYMWMQWRIVYMFATLHQQWRPEPAWLALAQDGYQFLVQHGKAPNGDYYFALNREGTPSTAPYEPFANCFATAGCAALYAATGQEPYRREAQAAMEAYLRRIENPKAQWEKALSGRKPYRALGPYMILANLGQLMNQCLQTTQYTADIEQAIHAVQTIFWQPDHRVIFENVTPDGQADLTSSLGRHIIPGHGLEACWFILEHAAATHQTDLATKLINNIADMILGLLDFGWDQDHGGIYYFMDVLGKPHFELQADMKLWWVHNEALLATLYAYRLTRDPRFLHWFKKIDHWTWTHFPDHDSHTDAKTSHNEWFGYLNRQGHPTHQLKGGKWKTFFHLPRFLLLGHKQLQAILNTQNN